uniref:Uncharacterized protein n=1 Tax=Arundo donax TaxID=35708 RepID=A0A0A9CGG8_ARUDO
MLHSPSQHEVWQQQRHRPEGETETDGSYLTAQSRDPSVLVLAEHLEFLGQIIVMR